MPDPLSTFSGTVQGNGFATALGLTFGWRLGEAGYAGLVGGIYGDPSTKVLPGYLRKGVHPLWIHNPPFKNLEGDDAKALIASEGIEIPLSTTMGRYSFIGFVLQFQL